MHTQLLLLPLCAGRWLLPLRPIGPVFLTCVPLPLLPLLSLLPLLLLPLQLHCSLGLVLCKLGDSPRALRHLRRALALQPEMTVSLPCASCAAV